MVGLATAIVFLIVEITSSEPGQLSRMETTTTDVNTRFIIDPSTDASELVLNKANEPLWTETAHRFNADFKVKLNISTFEQIKNPTYETTGGFRLKEIDPLYAEFDGTYGLEPVTASPYSTIPWGN
jgi:hypothetical protein